ncbi:hypothetical protein G7Y31_08285 [Corynebacterium lizhenjunii]|uniref:Uncharacterized protein n=1 Tax=Corynebacterium lizhenjunii TaxID=2709394 RepID=A0A7T0KDU9_9CORY|nr:hypothetical protein [Corynebacterium lizhenjunii]QPK78551.1 hypothetical protein G7Y31_08285 [Corynebacterium lizhenjunii]
MNKLRAKFISVIAGVAALAVLSTVAMWLTADRHQPVNARTVGQAVAEMAHTTEEDPLEYLHGNANVGRILEALGLNADHLSLEYIPKGTPESDIEPPEVTVLKEAIAQGLLTQEDAAAIYRAYQLGLVDINAQPNLLP